MKKIKIGLIQSRVLENKEENVKNAINNIKEVSKKGANIVMLPEMFNCPYTTENFPIYAEEKGHTWKALSKAARDNNVYLIGGSIPELNEDKVYNTSYIFDKNGEELGKHRKVHLFDIEVEGGQCFKESDTLTAGDNVTVVDTEYGKIGIVICYDFRFPEICRLMVQEGAKFIFVPAAFNMTTGPAHWEILFRTRALDNQVYTVGCAPARDYDGCYTSYGNSIIVSPWGDIVSKLDEKEQNLVQEIDLDKIVKVRNELPMLKHIRHDMYKLKNERNELK